MKNRITITIIALLLAISPVMPAFAAEAAPDLGRFAGEAVTAVYSLDYEARTYQKVTGKVDMQSILRLLEKAPPVEANGPDTVGFLVLTEKGRYPVYLPAVPDGKNKTITELVKLSKDCNGRYKSYAQWLIYMDPGKITGIQYSGMSGGRFTNNPKAEPLPFDVSLQATMMDFESICDYLKTMPVKTVSVVKNGGRDGRGSSMGISFSGNIYYTFYLGDNQLTVESSDRSEEITYEIDGNAFRDFFAGRPGAAKIYLEKLGETKSYLNNILAQEAAFGGAWYSSVNRREITVNITKSGTIKQRVEQALEASASPVEPGYFTIRYVGCKYSVTQLNNYANEIGKLKIGGKNPGCAIDYQANKVLVQVLGNTSGWAKKLESAFGKSYVDYARIVDITSYNPVT